MPLDYKAAVYAAVMARLKANTGVTNTFKSGNIHDEQADGPRRQRLASRSLVDVTSIDLELVGGEEQASRTPNFGMTRTAVLCDYIIPCIVTLRIKLRFRSEMLTAQTAGESYVRQALHTGDSKLGLSYVRDFTTRETRKPPNEANGIAETTLTLTVNLRLHASQLR